MNSRKRLNEFGKNQFKAARVLVGSIFLFLPFVISLNGLDKFRTPKDIAALVMITVLAIVCLASPSFRMKLSGFEIILVVTVTYVLLHSFLWGSVEKAVTVCLFSLWILLLSRLLSWEFQKRLWLLAGLSLSVNSFVNLLQSLGKFPWMLRENENVISGRFTAAGFLGEVNSGSLLFGLLVLVSLYFLICEKKKSIWLLWVVICLSNLTGLIVTRTLTSILCLILSLVLWLIFHHWWVFKRNPKSKSRLLAFWMVIVLSVPASFFLASQSKLLDRLMHRAELLKVYGKDEIASVPGSFFKSELLKIYGKDEIALEVTSSGRYAAFLITWAMIQERPLWGGGLGSFAPTFYETRVGTEYGRNIFMIPQSGAFQQAHNEYLQIWAELGLPGLLLLLGLLAYSFFSATRASIREIDAQKSYWFAVLGISLLYFGLASLMIFPFHITVAAILLTFIVASIRNKELYGSKDLKSQTVLRMGRARGYLTVLAILAAIPVIVGQYYKWQTNNTLGIATFLLEQANQPNHSARQRRTLSSKVLSMLNETEAGYDGFPEIHNLKGSAAMFLGRHQLATASYEEVTKQIPSPETMTNLAAALIAQNKCEEAEVYLDSALAYRNTYEKARRAKRHCRKKDN